MSIHKSLRSGSALARARNVYTRTERVEILMRSGRIKSGDPVVGLPKTRVIKVVKRGKKKKKEDDEK